MNVIGTGAAARRSRGSFYDDSQKNERALRGLLHDEETEDEQEEGSIFLPVPVRLAVINVYNRLKK